MSQLLSGKIAFITGSTRGIGWSAAQLFSSHGATVILNGYSNANLLKERVQFLQDTYKTPAHGILADVGDSKQIAGCYREIIQKFATVDIVVNNAGIMQPALLGMISDEVIAKSFNVNAIAVIHSMQTAARVMMRKKQGAIVNISSILGLHGFAGQVVYSATKAAVVGMTKSAAKELAPHNIRVNCVAPGFIETDMTEKQSRDIIHTIPLGHIGSPEAVANAILYLASPLSEYVTGQVLGVDGGMIV